MWVMWMMERRTLRRSLLIAAATLLVAPVTVDATASNFGSTSCSGDPANCVSLANNVYHAIRWHGQVGNQIPGIDDAVLWSVANNYNPTDLIAYRDESDPLPDVWVHDYNYRQLNGIAAWVVCGSDNTGTGGAHPNRWGRGQHLRYNSWYYTYWTGIYDTPSQRRFMACHELGHTVGLRHRLDSKTCMYQYVGEDAIGLLTVHDEAHINARY